MAELKDDWLSLTDKFNVSIELSEEIFTDLLARYNEAGRYYHNLQHIANLLSLARKYADLIRDKDSLAFAIWFHDCIYVPSRRDNEEKSVQYARIAMERMHIDDWIIQKVGRYIMATAGHVPASKDYDLQVFLDLDLSILGADEEVYMAYAAQIRKEYSSVPDLLYKSGRKGLLKGFLKRDRLFYVLGEEYEHQARINIRDEIERLKFSLW